MKETGMQSRLLTVLAGLAALVAAPAAQADPQFDKLKARGELTCGTRGDTVGFSHRDAQGKYSGLAVDICRAIAAAVFGNADKVKIVPLEGSRRIPALREGTVDVLVAATTYTLSRDVAQGVEFVGIYYFDTQAFMASRKLGKKSARELNGTSICVQTGTTTVESVADFFQNNNMAFKTVAFNAVEEMRQAFFNGKCDVMAADRSAVYAARAAYAGNPAEYIILPESGSRDPLGLVVREGDRTLADIVRWSLYAMIEAEEYGITSANVDEMARSTNPNVKRILGGVPESAKAMSLDDKWVYNIVKQVGNYGECYERNVGANSALRIPRSLNSLASQGGMLYSPPLR
jgi:general L-amino acid transport system substrate-binding protein